MKKNNVLDAYNEFENQILSVAKKIKEKGNPDKLVLDLKEFSIDQIESLRAQLRTVEEKIKESGLKNKVKTITISESAHNKIKKYCVDNDLKINEWVEKELLGLIKNEKESK